MVAIFADLADGQDVLATIEALDLDRFWRDLTQTRVLDEVVRDSGLKYFNDDLQIFSPFSFYPKSPDRRTGTGLEARQSLGLGEIVKIMALCAVDPLVERG